MNDDFYFVDIIEIEALLSLFSDYYNDHQCFLYEVKMVSLMFPKVSLVLQRTEHKKCAKGNTLPDCKQSV